MIEKPLFITPPDYLHHFSLGFNDFLANILWVRFVQNSDFCSFDKGLPEYKGTIMKCKQSWAHYMIDTITNLAPRFKSAYLISIPIISIFIGDKEGAERILLKSLNQFPDSWRLNFFAVYHYTRENPDPKKTAKHAYVAAKNGGPRWLYRLAVKENTKQSNTRWPKQ